LVFIFLTDAAVEAAAPADPVGAAGALANGCGSLHGACDDVCGAEFAVAVAAVVASLLAGMSA